MKRMMVFWLACVLAGCGDGMKGVREGSGMVARSGMPEDWEWVPAGDSVLREDFRGDEEERKIRMEVGNVYVREFPRGRYEGMAAKVSREEFRTSRDIFLHGRGDSVYLLYDVGDALQKLDERGGFCWMTRRKTVEEKCREEYTWQRMRAGVIICFMDESWGERAYTASAWGREEDVPVVDSAFVAGVRPVTREEFAAFYWRERRRRTMEWARTGNFWWKVRQPFFLDDYFERVFLLVPTGDGRFSVRELS